MSRWTEAEYKEHLVKRMREPKPSKYKAVKTTVDGIVFDSKKEAQRYHELKLMEKAGKIRNLLLQQRYALFAHSHIAGEPSVILGHYVADFTYQEYDKYCEDWAEVVEDVKGVKTAMYRWKVKHLRAQDGIIVRET